MSNSWGSNCVKHHFLRDVILTLVHSESNCRITAVAVSLIDNVNLLKSTAESFYLKTSWACLSFVAMNSGYSPSYYTKIPGIFY